MKILTEVKAEKLISKYLPIAKSVLVKNFKQVEKVKIKFPLVLKIISQKALHKTELKAIRVVKQEEDLEKEFNELLKLNKKKRLNMDGILVQEFVEGKEIIVGLKKDMTFGHVIMLGLGGIFVELLKDVTFRACPITKEDSQSMINDLKGNKILFGFRGEKGVNIELLKELLVKTSKIPLKNQKIAELDINPLIINDKKALVVDARIVLE